MIMIDLKKNADIKLIDVDKHQLRNFFLFFFGLFLFFGFLLVFAFSFHFYTTLLT